jgi:hypothetical protein
MSAKLSFLDKAFVALLLVVFGGIVLHAPLSVGLSTLWPDYALAIKSWKEIILGVALLLAAVIITVRKQWSVLQTKIIGIIILFAALNLLLIPAYFNGFDATVAGLFINLRYLLFFVLVYVALRLYPQYYRLFLNVFIAGALVVIGFAVLQLTVLPHDVLKYIGYGESTIMPYLTVDQNMDYIRINSTLRGPNPLGVYAVIAIAVAIAAWLRAPRTLTKQQGVIVGVLGIGGAVAVWASYSRSAALAGLAAVGIILLVAYGRQISKVVWISLFVAALVVGGSLVALRDTTFVSQVILHEDPHEGNTVNSNDGHAESLVDGTRRMLMQPLGAGIGSTGSASLLGDKPVIIENQYLFIAHETGWVGLVMFLYVHYLVLHGLWQRRKQWLTLAVFASGVGIAIAGLVLPVWVDDTVSMVWWGLAAVCLALPILKGRR